MKVIFIHLFNNFSGSPNVLSILIKGLVNSNNKLELLTSRTDGFLSSIPRLKYTYICYKLYKNNLLLTATLFFIAQLQLFFMLLVASKKNRIYYINTITPIGAIWACKLTGKNYYIHVHENMQSQKFLFAFYRWTYKCCNKKSIFVSDYVRKQALNVRDSIVVYNALGKEFIQKVKYIPLQERHTILMLCSLRLYKGIQEFVLLAKCLPEYQFEMVVSDEQARIDVFLQNNLIPRNLIIYPSHSDVHLFYQRARLVLNLSKPTYCIETFGLTLLEAITYGIPVIGPPIGGPTEIIDDGINGFLIDADNIDKLKEKIVLLMENDDLYLELSKNALQKAKAFSSEQMVSKIKNYLHLI